MIPSIVSSGSDMRRGIHVRLTVISSAFSGRSTGVTHTRRSLIILNATADGEMEQTRIPEGPR